MTAPAGQAILPWTTLDSENISSVNPARSTGPAVFVGDWAFSQLWLFWLAPIVGALLAGFVYHWLGGDDS